jgi:hypothetical protein
MTATPALLLCRESKKYAQSKLGKFACAGIDRRRYDASHATFFFHYRELATGFIDGVTASAFLSAALAFPSVGK